MKSGSGGLRLEEFLIGLMIFSWVFSIVELLPGTVSPIIFTPFAALASQLRRLPRLIGYVVSTPVAGSLIFLLLLQAILPFVVSGTSDNPLGNAGRMVAGIAFFVAITGYTSSGTVSFYRGLGMFCVALGVSLLWFLLEISVGDPFVTWRFALYLPLYAGQDAAIAETIRTGLTPFLHLLGYQVAILAPILTVVAASRPFTGRLRLLAALALPVCALSVFFSAQRGALVSICIAVAVLIARLKLRTAARAILPFALLVVPMTLWLSTGVGWRSDLLSTTLLDKVRAEESLSGSVFRAVLQVRALKLIAEHPFGLPVDHKNWVDEGYSVVAEDWSWQAAPDGAIAVHNAYLGPALDFGLIVLIPTVVMMALLLGDLVRLIRSRKVPDFAKDAAAALTLSVVAGAIGLTFILPMTHNAGLLSLEPVSLFVLSQVVLASRPFNGDGRRSSRYAKREPSKAGNVISKGRFAAMGQRP